MSQDEGSPSVSLVYVVKNQDVLLNGTISSGLLNQLTAELVGYFLFYPPLVIAERKSNLLELILVFEQIEKHIVLKINTLERLWLSRLSWLSNNVQHVFLS